ncbi:hypothetical protein [Streptomyces sp. NPDC006638]|uniref:hypothetical protein n=1 Tax=Streptomyces sp. NPDC006638 TaxID=3157183 RepID=UPI00339F9241
MAIEITDDLVGLQQKALGEEAKARSVPYSVSAWAPWLRAAQEVDAAITEYAKEKNKNRMDVAIAVRKAAVEAMADQGSDGDGGSDG